MFCATSFNMKSSAYGPQSAFMGFMWISEQTTVILQCSINCMALQPRKCMLTARTD